MSESKISIKVGIVEFSGEGEPRWLSEQLDKILEKVPELLKIELTNSGNTGSSSGSSDVGNQRANRDAPTNLATFLKQKNATAKQVEKFLATAAFLQLNGLKPVTTSAVNKAIKDAHQNKLNNTSDCLNQNVRKGYCEKDGSGFFVTETGLDQVK